MPYLLGVFTVLIVALLIYLINNTNYKTKKAGHGIVHYRKSWENEPEFFYVHKIRK